MAVQPRAPLKIQSVPLLEALGRVVAQDVFSEIDIPPQDNSAMDGFAIHTEPLTAVEEVRDLVISQRVAAGSVAAPLKKGTAARIFTGASIPPGANAVVIQENCEYNQSSIGSSVKISGHIQAGINIRPRGQDITCGTKILSQGQRLNAVDLSLIASIGHDSVVVYEPLRVGVFSTGDELAEPGEALREGQIYNSNRTLLLAMCRELNYQPVDCGIVPDTLEHTKATLQSLAEDVHVIISSGGVSVGEEDHVKPAVASVGSLDLWKVQIKPGKPVAFGSVGEATFLGLPGNPVSSFVVFQLLAVPLMGALQGALSEAPIEYSVVSGFDKKRTTREEYIRVKLIQGVNGQQIAEPFSNLSSGVMSSLSWADGLVRHDINKEIVKGEPVSFLPFNRAML